MFGLPIDTWVGGLACDWPRDLFCLWDAAQPALLVEITNAALTGVRF
jgi:hypothetical protein